MKFNKDTLPGIVLGVLAIGYLAMTTQIKVFTGPGAAPLSARAIPYMWGFILLMLSVLLILRGMRQGKEKSAIDSGSQNSFSPKRFYLDNHEVILTFLFLGVYIALLKPIGFLIMSAAYIFAESLVLSKRRNWNLVFSLILGIVVACVIDFVFVRMLGVMLPKGILSF